MIEMSLAEAQLYRMLGAFFGRERVIWNMSVRTVCGGQYPALENESSDSVAEWAESSACLFTIIDSNDDPKMVVEFAPDFSLYIEVSRIDRQHRLPVLLDRCGVRYITVTSDEFQELIDPSSSLDLVALLKDKFGIEDAIVDSDLNEL